MNAWNAPSEVWGLVPRSSVADSRTVRMTWKRSTTQYIAKHGYYLLSSWEM